MTSEDFPFNKPSEKSEITSQRVRVVLPVLEKRLGDLTQFRLDDSEIEGMSEKNRLAIDRMTEEELVAFLATFLTDLKKGMTDRETLLNHPMFRLALTNAIKIKSESTE